MSRFNIFHRSGDFQIPVVGFHMGDLEVPPPLLVPRLSPMPGPARARHIPGFTLLAGVLAALLPASAQNLQIQGNPLQISANEYGTIGVLYQGIPQYYATSAKGSVLFLDGPNTQAAWGSGTSTFALWDDAETGRFSPISHTQPDPWTIQTVLGAGESGVEVHQTLTYTDGNPFYTLTWEIFIAGESEGRFTDVRFKHGGDVSPNGQDMAQGFWTSESNQVYVLTADSPPFFMALQGDAESPASHHAEAHFQVVRDACKSGDLPDTVDPSLHDAGYALEWNRPSLGIEESWFIRAHEWFAGTPSTLLFTNVTLQVADPLFTWELSRQTGTFFGDLTISNLNGTLSAPFWCALDQNADRRFMQPNGTMPNGQTYIDLTPDVTAQTGTQLSRGESVVITNLEVYMRFRTAPPDAAFSIWATTTAPQVEE